MIKKKKYVTKFCNLENSLSRSFEVKTYERQTLIHFVENETLKDSQRMQRKTFSKPQSNSDSVELLYRQNQTDFKSGNFSLKICGLSEYLLFYHFI